jgi:MFS family permease
MTRRRSSPWQIVALLGLVACLNYADRTAISSVFPLLRSELGMSDMALAAIGSVFLWTYAIGSPFAGWLADRFSRSTIVVSSLAAWSVVTILTGVAANANQLLATRVLLGLAECAYLPAAIALIADHHSAATRATAMGAHLAGLNFGLVAGAPVAGYLGEHYGWRMGFLLLGSLGLVVAGVARWMLWDLTTPEERAAARVEVPVMEPVKAVLRVPTYVVQLLEAMLAAVGTWMFANWLPLYFRETFNLSLTGAGFSATFMMQAAAMIGVTSGGYFSDLIAKGGLHRRMLFQFCCIFASAPFLLTFLTKPSYAIISGSIFAFALLRSLGGSNEHAVMCDLLPANLRSTAIGLMNTASCMAGGIGIMVAGYLKSTLGLAGVFAGISGIVVTSGLIVVIGYIFYVRKDLAKVYPSKAITPLVTTT